MTIETSRRDADVPDGMAWPGPGRIFLFTYGANMHPEQCAFLGVRPFSVRPARLADHELGFYGYSHRWDGAVETVAPALGRAVWGALYELGFSALERLDAWQGARFDGAGPYFHFPVTVRDGDGTPFFALCYKKDILGTPALPSAPYLEFILQGAKARGLPEGYVAMLGNLESRPAAYAVPSALQAPPGDGGDCLGCLA